MEGSRVEGLKGVNRAQLELDARRGPLDRTRRWSPLPHAVGAIPHTRCRELGGLLLLREASRGRGRTDALCFHRIRHRVALLVLEVLVPMVAFSVLEGGLFRV